MIYHVAIAMVIFSHVKISSFRMKAQLVFHWCLYNKVCYYYYYYYYYLLLLLLFIIIIITTMYSGTLPYCHLSNTVTLLLWPLFLGPAK